ncbi:hypothetical protein SAMN05877809_11159 [Rhodobacter sp. JA431]|nr:hypothetical protein SAMN05877809_11159 [Rhodobacter sp. JA431]
MTRWRDLPPERQVALQIAYAAEMAGTHTPARWMRKSRGSRHGLPRKGAALRLRICQHVADRAGRLDQHLGKASPMASRQWRRQSET